MVEAYLDLWETKCDARCITTNGFVKSNGALVMGAGVAGQAQDRFPEFPKVAGKAVKDYGNIVMAFRSDWLRKAHAKPGTKTDWFITFPVKHKWYESADLTLIESSAHQLMELINEPGFSFMEKVFLPRPGCGNGKLTWGQVKPVLKPILDERVWVIDK